MNGREGGGVDVCVSEERNIVITRFNRKNDGW